MEILRLLIEGIPMTIGVTLTAFTLGAALAVPVLVLLRAPLAPVRIAARVVVDLVRGVPPIVWLFILYFGLGAGTYQLSSFQAAAIGLGVISAGYLAEIYRGALIGVHEGQFEAGHALGLHTPTIYARVVGPQAVRIALPSLATYLISLTKDSAVASTIGVTEVMFGATSMVRSGSNGLVVLGLAAAVYIALSLPLAYLSRRLDLRLRTAVNR